MKRESQFELCPFLVSPQNNLLQSNFSKRTRTVWIVKAPRKRRATSTINSETAKRCNFDFVTCPISQRRLGSRFLRLYLPAMNSLTQDPIRAKLEAESVKAVAESGKVSHSHFSHIDIAEFEHTSLCSRASHERTTCFVNHQKVPDDQNSITSETQGFRIFCVKLPRREKKGSKKKFNPCDRGGYHRSGS